MGRTPSLSAVRKSFCSPRWAILAPIVEKKLADDVIPEALWIGQSVRSPGTCHDLTHPLATKPVGNIAPRDLSETKPRHRSSTTH